jgi:hypothetical protein
VIAAELEPYLGALFAGLTVLGLTGLLGLVLGLF